MIIAAKTNRRAGITLVECLVYIAVLLVLLGLVFTAFTRLQQQSSYLKRNVEDISRVLRAGEQWRDEVRRSSAVGILVSDDVPILRLQHRSREILYAFQKDHIWRKELPEGEWKLFLKGVRTSEMRPETGRYTTAWIWDFELISAQKTVRLRPLFSFIAVPGFYQLHETSSITQQE